MPSLLTDLQRVDENNLDKMKSSWDTFIDFYERSLPGLQEIVKTLRDGFRSFSKEKDMQDFYNQVYTGSILILIISLSPGNPRPPLAQYEPTEKGPKQQPASSNISGPTFGGSYNNNTEKQESKPFRREPMQYTGK